MAMRSFGARSAVLLAVIWAYAITSTAEAQLIRAPLDRGFARTSSIAVTVDEMLGAQKPRPDGEPIVGPGYPHLWIAEVQYKPVRYRLMQVTDLETGEKKSELVWYMVYRVIARDYTELAGTDGRDNLIRKLSDQNLIPQNPIDDVQRFPLQIPRFVLQTEDTNPPKTYVDEINLEVQREVLLREFQRRKLSIRLLNSVQAIAEVVDPVSVEDPDQLQKALYGVAVWRGVDPQTDYFTVTMSGFSNAYQITTADAGSTVVQHKVVEQRFERPGDEFQQREREFRLVDRARLLDDGRVVISAEASLSTYGGGRPEPAFVDTLRSELKALEVAGQKPEITWPRWLYEERPAAIDVPEYQPILRNVPAVSQAAAAPQP